MSYKNWFNSHADKHKKIVDKLLSNGYLDDEIIEYFEYENMVLNEKDFCPLYEKNQKCHEMQNLNCYLCACPNFRFSDDGIKKVDDKTQHSFCSIDSKDGKQGVYGAKIHQDCSGCIVPHKKEYVKKHFSTNWREVMGECCIGC